MEKAKIATEHGISEWAYRAVYEKDVHGDVKYPLDTKFDAGDNGRIALSTIVDVIRQGYHEGDDLVRILRLNPDVAWTSLQHSIQHHVAEPNLRWRINEKLAARGAIPPPNEPLPHPFADEGWQKTYNHVTNAITAAAFEPRKGDISLEELIDRYEASRTYTGHWQDALRGQSSRGVGVAQGGKLPGYGGGDRVQALLEPGEFVLRKEAAKKYGIDFLHMLNAQKLRTGGPVQSIALMQQGGDVESAQFPKLLNIGEEALTGFGDLSSTYELEFITDESAIFFLNKTLGDLSQTLGGLVTQLDRMGERIDAVTQSQLTQVESLINSYGNVAQAAARTAGIENTAYVTKAKNYDKQTESLRGSKKDSDKLAQSMLKGSKVSTEGLKGMITALKDMPIETTAADFDAGINLIKASLKDFQKDVPDGMKISAEDTGAVWEETLGITSDRSYEQLKKRNVTIRDTAIKGGAGFYSTWSKYLMDTQEVEAKYWQEATAAPKMYSDAINEVSGTAIQ